MPRRSCEHWFHSPDLIKGSPLFLIRPAVALLVHPGGSGWFVLRRILQRKQKMSFLNNVDSFNTSFHVHMPGTRTEILTWLSPLDQGIRHEEVQSCRVPGVGDWLLDTPVFRSWSDVSLHDKSDSATLFCYGDPGIGKTYIT